MTVMNKRKGLPRLGLFWYQHSMRVQAPYNRATCYNRATGFDSFMVALPLSPPSWETITQLSEWKA